MMEQLTFDQRVRFTRWWLLENERSLPRVGTLCVPMGRAALIRGSRSTALGAGRHQSIGHDLPTRLS